MFEIFTGIKQNPKQKILVQQINTWAFCKF